MPISVSAVYVTPSDNLKYSNDTEFYNSWNLDDYGSTWHPTYDITTNTVLNGTVRIKYDAKFVNYQYAYSQVRANGAAIGDTQALTTVYTTYPQEIYISLNNLSTLGVWLRNTGGTSTYSKNFRVYYDVVSSVPTLPVTVQHPNYFDSASTTISWSQSTDLGNDAIIYSVKVGTSSNATNILNYNDTDTTSDSFIMTPPNSYYYSVRACDPYECSNWSAEKSFGFAVTTPYTPINGSALTKSYPPITSNIAFTWSEIGGGLNYNLLISKDVHFNLIAVDTTTPNNYSTQALEAGNYWWKVQYYNSSSQTFYNWSAVFNFTLINNVTTSGTVIDGVAYELINGVQTPVSEATVFIQHSAGNWSSQMTTGSNGYYLFSNLATNTIYYVYAVKKDYQNSATEYITTGSGTITTRDILLRPTEPTDFESDKQYVKFSARWLWCLFNCNIEGATISAYNYGDVIAYASGITDSTGSVSYRLYKTQRYRVTVVNSTAGISQEMTLYPKDSEYVFLITNAGKTMQEHDVQQKDAIKISVSKSIIDSVNATITINYTDSLAGTTALTYYIKQSNSTVVQSWTWAAGTYNHTFLISGYSGQSYMVNVVASHAVYGTIDRSYAVPFEKTAGVGIAGISDTLWLWFAIGMVFFTAAMFTSSTVEKGLLIVCGQCWIFFFMGMFNAVDPIQFTISLTLASVIAVFAYIRRAQASEGLA